MRTANCKQKTEKKTSSSRSESQRRLNGLGETQHALAEHIDSSGPGIANELVRTRTAVFRPGRSPIQQAALESALMLPGALPWQDWAAKLSDPQNSVTGLHKNRVQFPVILPACAGGNEGSAS